jgi:putative ABC transport system permease protein
MTGRRGWRRVFRLDVGRDHVQRDVDEELAFHLTMRAEKLQRQGVDAETAAGQARARFGDLAIIRDELLTIDHGRERAAKRGSRIEHLRRDLVYATRALRHHRGFSAVVVLTLALGIGANTAIFSLVNGLLLRPISVSHPEQLVALGDVTQTNSVWAGSPRTDVYSYPLYKDIRDNNSVFSGIYGTTGEGAAPLQFVLGRPSATDSSFGGPAPAPKYPNARYVTANYFSVLGVGAANGRVFRPDDDLAIGADPVLVISDGYWQRRFDRDPDAIGRTVSVNHVPMTIVGVTPPNFTGDIVAERTDVWIPISMEPVLVPTDNWLNDRGTDALLLMGRLKPGVTFAQARAELIPLIRRLLDQAAQGNPKARVAGSQYDDIRVTPGARGFSYWRAQYSTSLYTLLVVVLLVLLIVCANVATLLLGRATSRGREIGVRLALGAGRGRIVQQLMIESLTLAVTGGALGLLLAHWGIALLLRLAAGGGSVLTIDTRLDGGVLAFTATLAVTTALLFGLAPALRATRLDLNTVLRAHSRGLSGTWRRFGAARGLVGVQVALSLTMLVATGMVVRSLRALETGDIGLDRDHLLIATVNTLKLQRSDSALEVMREELAAKLQALPGVRAVSYSTNGLFTGSDRHTTFEIPGFVPRVESDSMVAEDVVGPGYFRAIGAQMLQGRGLTTSDMGDPGPVAVVNEAFAKKFFPNADPIGKSVARGGPPYRIVGVVQNVHVRYLRGTPEPRLYVPMWETGSNYSTFEVRTAGKPALLAQPVRRVLQATEPALRIGRLEPLNDLTRASIRQDILMARLVSGFGVLALVLSAMGLYAVLSYATLRRTGEFGLRMALGAKPATILRMVLREGLVLIVFGLLAGVPLLVIGTTLLRSELYGVGPFDPLSIVFAVLVLVVSALLAGLLPARRAARVGPLVALQSE